jgi:glycosyltransferase involved in cell wall biosynthesis
MAANDTRRVEAVVLLGTRWSELSGLTTRWHQVVRRWAARSDMRVVVVDFPRFAPGRVQVQALPSWLPSVEAISVTVPLWRRSSLPGERAGWRRTADALMNVVGPASHDRIVVATTPLWVPLLEPLRPLARTAFDAYDDWRALPSMAAVRRRVRHGYAAGRAADTVTFGSPALAERLQADFGLPGRVVRNGVDLPRLRAGGAAPAGTPDEPFAVYLGVVQERVDLDLLSATTQVLATVVAGPVPAGARAMLERRGVRCLGPIGPELVPGLLQRAAVGLVPHRVDALTTSMDPLKILEYRAASLPVVATAVAGADADGVDVVTDAASWTSAVARAVAAGPRPAAGLRDWDRVAEELLMSYVAPLRDPATAAGARLEVHS